MDTARSVASDPRAPADERFDANAELQRGYRPLASELIPSSAIQPVIDMIQSDFADADMRKAQQIMTVPFGGHQRPTLERGMRSVYVDNLQILVSGDTYEKPGPLGFDALRQMVEQTPILNAVIMTRIRQISRYCQISEDGGPGFEIRSVDRKHIMTSDEEESAKLLSRFVLNCGWEFNPRKRKAMRRDNFRSFVSKIVRDSLTMDACPIETEMKRDRTLGIDGFYAVDGATIRLCTEEGYDGDDEIYALQTLQGRIATAYTRDQLIYEVRNPRTDVRLAGYGMGEAELLVRVVTGFLNAMTYNIAGFDNNAIPKGLLQLSGDYGKEDLAAFRRYWNAQVKGVNNAWALPVMVATDPASKVAFEAFGTEFNEMHFAKWMTFLTSIVCAIYGMSPDEINFESFAAQSSSMSGNDTAEKLTASKDVGLRPNLTFLESTISDFIVSEFTDKLCFRWVGVDEADDDKDWEAKKLVLTVDEMRAEKGYKPHPDPKIGGLPLNPVLVGPAMQLNAPAPEPEQPEQGSAFGGGPGDPKPDYGDPDAGQGGAGAAGSGGQSGGDDIQGGAGDFGKALTIFTVGG